MTFRMYHITYHGFWYTICVVLGEKRNSPDDPLTGIKCTQNNSLPLSWGVFPFHYEKKYITINIIVFFCNLQTVVVTLSVYSFKMFYAVGY